MGSEYEQEIPSVGRADQERLPFPRIGHTLFLNSIGQRGAVDMIHLLRFFDRSYGHREVLASSLFGVDRDTKELVEQAMKIGWFGRPTVALNSAEVAIKVFNEQSEKYGNTGRAIFHFISYELGNGRMMHDTIKSLLESLPNLLHLGILFSPHGDVVAEIQAQKEVEKYPPQDLGIPLLAINHYPKTQSSDQLTVRDGVLYGLAGLVTNHRVFPHINPYSYVELLRILTDESPHLAASLCQTYTGLIRTLGHPLGVTSLGDLEDKTISAITKSFSADSSLIDSQKPAQARINLVSVQIPLHPKYPSWQDVEFVGDINNGFRFSAQASNITVPDKVVVTYNPALQVVKRGSFVSIVALNLFPYE